MDRLINILLLIDTLMIVSTMWASIYFRKYKKIINNVKVDENDVGMIYIFLPALREQKIVKETLDHFSKLKMPNFKIVVITSEKEEHEKRQNGNIMMTTGECVDEYIKKNNSYFIMHFHCPLIVGTKSTQLNYAAEKIRNMLTETKQQHCYIGVYDFDSRPNLDVLADFQKLLSFQNFPEIIQQVPVNLKNIDGILQNNNFLMLLHCLQSNIRAIGIELFTLLLHMFGIQAPLYCMGAGMYIRFDTLISNGLFPEPVDDLTLGYRLYLNKKRFAVLPNFNLVEAPDTVKSLINQDRLIFTGVWSGLEELHAPSTIFRKIFMGATIIHNIILRTLLPWFFAGYVLLHLLVQNINVQCVLILLYPFIRTVIGLFSVIISDKDKVVLLKKKVFYNALIWSMVWRPIRTIGALKIIPRLIFKKQIVYKKTER